MKILKAVIFLLTSCMCQSLVAMQDSIEYYKSRENRVHLLRDLITIQIPGRGVLNAKQASKNWRRNNLPDLRCILTTEECNAAVEIYTAVCFSTLFLADACENQKWLNERHDLLFQVAQQFYDAIKNPVIKKLPTLKNTEVEVVKYLCDNNVKPATSMNPLLHNKEMMLVLALFRSEFKSRGSLFLTLPKEITDLTSQDATNYRMECAKLCAQIYCLFRCINLVDAAFRELYENFLKELDAFMGKWFSDKCYQKYWAGILAINDLDAYKECTGEELCKLPQNGSFLKKLFTDKLVREKEQPPAVIQSSTLSIAVPSVLLIAAACGGGYYFYNKNRNNKRKRSSSVDHQKKENQGNDVVEQVAN